MSVIVPSTGSIALPVTRCSLGSVSGPRVDIPDYATIEATLRIDRTIVHTESGWRIAATRRGDSIGPTSPGGRLEFSVVPVDTEGFIDVATGEAVTYWVYILTATFRWKDTLDGKPRTETITKSFQPLTEHADLDLDLVPDDAVPLPAMYLPVPAVTSVAGHTGVVTTAQLADELADSFDAAGAASAAQAAAITAAATDATNKVAAEATARAAAIQTAINNLIASAPGVLDTLDELAAALGDDPNFATTVLTALAGKQPLDSDLTAIAALTTTAFGRGFLDLLDAAAARTKLGLGTAATQPSTAFEVAGAAAAAQAAAISAAAADATSKVAAEATARATAITSAINNLVAAAPGALDTLDELAAALGDDANFATTVTNALAGKLAKSANLGDLASKPQARANLAAVAYGSADPSAGLSSGTEYAWFKTDGAGTLIDIVTGVA